MIMTSPTSAPATRKPPRRARRRLIAVGVTLAAGVGLAGLAAPAAFAGVDGGVDMNGACANQYGPGAHTYPPDGGNVYDWSCNSSTGVKLGGINVQEQCVAQYGAGAEAQSSDYTDPYTWYCYTPD